MIGLELLINLAVLVGPLVAAYGIGSSIERRHLADLAAREAETGRLVVATSMDTGLDGVWRTRDPALVMGSVVISIDHFKRFVASLRMLVGGPIRSYESLLLRARREAILRMQEQARALGRNAVINVRVESARIASSFANGKGTTGVEILAYDTAVVADVEAPRQLSAEQADPLPWQQNPFTEPAPARPAEPQER